MRRALLIMTLVLVGGCPPPSSSSGGGGSTGPRGGGGGGAAMVDPDGCGTINTGKYGAKLYAFLVASAELDRASSDLEGSVKDACRHMATDLGVSTDGDTRAVCNRAATELQANLQVSVKSEKRLVTRTVPPVCHTDVSLAASFAAQCEASAGANVDVTCQGQCDGTCNGACSGTCAGGAAGGQCNGQCNGTCNGKCSGTCEGYADVHASGECKASAEVHAMTHTTCTPARVEVVQQDVTIVDATKFAKAQQAIQDGLPQILLAGKKLELAGKAVANWVDTGAQLAQSTGEAAAELGEKAVCVAGQVAAVVGAAANIQARFSVSIEVSAQVTASAGAQ